jgi:hypothetical protein
MYKALCIAVLLLPTFVLAQSPQIVAKAKLSHQTAAIPTTTIYTPAQTGLYRLSVYATLTKTDPNSASYWLVNVSYTDDAGPYTLNQLLFTGSDNEIGVIYLYGSFPVGAVVPFEVKAGTPVTYSVTQNGPPDNSAYSLYYTLERLE